MQTERGTNSKRKIRPSGRQQTKRPALLRPHSFWLKAHGCASAPRPVSFASGLLRQRTAMCGRMTSHSSSSMAHTCDTCHRVHPSAEGGTRGPRSLTPIRTAVARESRHTSCAPTWPLTNGGQAQRPRASSMPPARRAWVAACIGIRTIRSGPSTRCLDPVQSMCTLSRDGGR